jgi:hypothetical protein
MAAGIRIDINLSHYAAMKKYYPECFGRLADILGRAVEEAIYEHAIQEIGPGCSAAAYRSIVARAAFQGLGPAWTPQAGSTPDASFNQMEHDYGMYPIGAYDDGAMHIVVRANFS